MNDQFLKNDQIHEQLQIVNLYLKIIYLFYYSLKQILNQKVTKENNKKIHFLFIHIQNKLRVYRLNDSKKKNEFIYLKKKI